MLMPVPIALGPVIVIAVMTKTVTKPKEEWYAQTEVKVTIMTAATFVPEIAFATAAFANLDDIRRLIRRNAQASRTQWHS
jgi:hypothetical protein